ncbi:hypothetical protein [Brevundimonas sp. SORGH_AS_0993]|uniref:hypothetical protein n=1 Tax=Brevundimonas sp. SORGH_AS_0993 TaxID=3041794 RepID=UPI00277DE909|nr:hypothetical protein [Brevundimonas sp. SORGH_AS_0993]MDQ1155186.1 hypothetical protein [Brevundimonas sp. SORGH_AS_0993]
MTAGSPTPDPAAPLASGPLLTRSQASVFLEQYGIHLKPGTLARLWSMGGNGPPCLHVRGKPFYPTEVLKTWAGSQITDLRASAPPAARRR